MNVYLVTVKQPSACALTWSGADVMANAIVALIHTTDFFVMDLNILQLIDCILLLEQF